MGKNKSNIKTYDTNGNEWRYFSSSEWTTSAQEKQAPRLFKGGPFDSRTNNVEKKTGNNKKVAASTYDQRKKKSSGTLSRLFGTSKSAKSKSRSKSLSYEMEIDFEDDYNEDVFPKNEKNERYLNGESTWLSRLLRNSDNKRSVVGKKGAKNSEFASRRKSLGAEWAPEHPGGDKRNYERNATIDRPIVDRSHGTLDNFTFVHNGKNYREIDAVNDRPVVGRSRGTLDNFTFVHNGKNYREIDAVNNRPGVGRSRGTLDNFTFVHNGKNYREIDAVNDRPGVDYSHGTLGNFTFGRSRITDRESDNRTSPRRKEQGSDGVLSNGQSNHQSYAPMVHENPENRVSDFSTTNRKRTDFHRSQSHQPLGDLRSHRPSENHIGYDPRMYNPYPKFFEYDYSARTLHETDTRHWMPYQEGHDAPRDDWVYDGFNTEGYLYPDTYLREYQRPQRDHSYQHQKTLKQEVRFMGVENANDTIGKETAKRKAEKKASKAAKKNTEKVPKSDIFKDLKDGGSQEVPQHFTSYKRWNSSKAEDLYFTMPRMITRMNIHSANPFRSVNFQVGILTDSSSFSASSLYYRSSSTSLWS